MPRWRASRAGSSPPARPFLVVDEHDRTLGEVTPEAVIDLLAGSDRPSSRMTDIASTVPAAVSDAKRLAARLGDGNRPGACSCMSSPARWPWAVAYPDGAVIPFARWVGEFMAFLQNNLHVAHARPRPRSRCPARCGFRRPRQGLQDRQRSRRDRSAAAVVAGRLRRGGDCRLFLWRAEARRAGRRLPSLHRVVRPVGQRHADPGADRHLPCRSAWSSGS